MKPKGIALSALAAAAAGALVLVPRALSKDGTARTAVEAPAAAAVRPGSVEALLYARPFALGAPYAFDWQAEPAPLREGWLLVLAVDPDLVAPKNELEPVLYGGDRTLERVNAGQGSGRLVAILPGGADLDLAATPFWFGGPELPERVTPATVAAERAAAEAAGVAPFPAAAVAAAREAGGPALALADRDALRRFAAELVRRHAPDEDDLVQGILAPRVR